MPSSTKSNPKNLLLLSQPTTKTSVAKPTIIKEMCYAYSTAARQTDPTPPTRFSCRPRRATSQSPVH
jgi:hypothetical protein